MCKDGEQGIDLKSIKVLKRSTLQCVGLVRGRWKSAGSSDEEKIEENKIDAEFKRDWAKPMKLSHVVNGSESQWPGLTCLI